MTTSHAQNICQFTAVTRSSDQTLADDAFVVLDVENLLFPYFVTRAHPSERREVNPDALARFAQLIARLAGAKRRIVAVGDRRLLPSLMPVAVAHGVRLVPTRPGPDSADLECIRRLLLELPTGCQEVVIGSGDGLFALPAKWLIAQGIQVSVLAAPGHATSAGLSRALRASASRVLATRVHSAA